MKKINSKAAKVIGDDLGINWNEVKLEEFTNVVSVELEHGTRYPETNGTNNDNNLTGNIASAHVKEFPEDLLLSKLNIKKEIEDKSLEFIGFGLFPERPFQIDDEV